MRRLDLINAAKRGRIPVLVERYLNFCRAAGEAKKAGRFPNLAGFCRWLGCGMETMDELRRTYPDQADYLVTVMEDEALNSPLLSPTIIGAYLKQRLTYGGKGSGDSSPVDCGEVKLVFEHDIAEDGG